MSSPDPMKNLMFAPHGVASPLAQWTAPTLIDSSSSKRSSSASYASIESAGPIDDMAVSEFILKHQAITLFVHDAHQTKRKRPQTSTSGKT